MKIKLGISPIMWCNEDFTDLCTRESWHTMLDQMNRIGYKSCEWSRQFPDKSREVLRYLESRGMSICNRWFDFTLTTEDLDTNLKRLEKHLSFLKKLRCGLSGGGETGNATYKNHSSPLIKRPRLQGMREWLSFGTKLNTCGALAKDFGTQLVFHPHVGTVVFDLNDIHRLLEVTDPDLVRLNFDTGHMYLAGVDPFEAAVDLLPRVGHIHLKNIRHAVVKKTQANRKSFEWAVRQGVFTVPGDQNGCIDTGKILRYFYENGYDGWYVVEAEQDPAQAIPEIYASHAFTYIHSLDFGRGKH